MNERSGAENQPGGDDAEQGRRKQPSQLARAWRGWQWFSRARSLKNWWLFFQTKLGAATGVAVVTGATIGTVAVMQPRLVTDVLSREPVAVQTTRWAPNTVVFPIWGTDTGGRGAQFDVAVLTRDTVWSRGKTDELERGAEALTGASIAGAVFTPAILSGLSESSDWIAVGVASEEGDPAVETERARRRAETSAAWMASASPTPRKIWQLNLGQFKSGCEADAAAGSDTSFQRPFMMIGVRWQQAGVVLGEALADAMSGKSNLPSPACYSRFEVK